MNGSYATGRHNYRDAAFDRKARAEKLQALKNTNRKLKESQDNLDRYDRLDAEDKKKKDKALLENIYNKKITTIDDYRHIFLNIFNQLSEYRKRYENWKSIMVSEVNAVSHLNYYTHANLRTFYEERQSLSQIKVFDRNQDIEAIEAIEITKLIREKANEITKLIREKANEQGCKKIRVAFKYDDNYISAFVNTHYIRTVLSQENHASLTGLTFTDVIYCTDATYTRQLANQPETCRFDCCSCWYLYQLQDEFNYDEPSKKVTLSVIEKIDPLSNYVFSQISKSSIRFDVNTYSFITNEEKFEKLDHLVQHNTSPVSVNFTLATNPPETIQTTITRGQNLGYFKELGSKLTIVGRGIAKDWFFSSGATISLQSLKTNTVHQNFFSSIVNFEKGVASTQSGGRRKKTRKNRHRQKQSRRRHRKC